MTWKNLHLNHTGVMNLIMPLQVSLGPASIGTVLGFAGNRPSVNIFDVLAVMRHQ